ncbi:MAG TPA: DUF2071 domain-containing protein [Blastocatellia bacterium]|jgi:hypothetical protein
MKLTMVGRLSECLLIAYRTPRGSVEHLVPAPLQLVTRDGWAFWNIVACRIEKMRPAGAPRLAGMSYYHVAYRLYVRARVASGEIIEGLHFVRSDADNFLVSELGNLASDFRFHTATVNHIEDAGRVIFEVRNSGADARLCVNCEREPGLARNSCFVSMKEAAQFLKYRPLGLSCRNGWLRVAEVFRDESQWRETAVSIEEARWSFFDAMAQGETALELATRVAPIDYRWRLGRRERLA